MGEGVRTETNAFGGAVGGRAAVSPWWVLAAAFGASVAAVMAQFAAPPLMPMMMAQLGIGIAEAGSTMSVFSITGFVLALPAGIVLQRFGPLVAGLLAMAPVIAGSVLAATTTDFGALLLARALQGVGVGLIGVAAPAVVAGVFAPGKRGVPMGIWAMWVPVGGLLMLLLAPPIATSWGMPAVWWLVAVVAALALVAYGLVLRLAQPTGGEGGSAGRAVADLRRGLAGRDLRLVALAFTLFALAASVSNTFTTTFLVERRGFDLATASSLAALVLAGVAVGSVGGGAISDRIRSRRLVLVGGLVALGALLAVPFAVGEPGLQVALPVVGFAIGTVPAVTFASAPELVPEPRLAGTGMAGVMLGQNAGFVLGPLVFAALVPAVGWPAAAAAFGLLALVGAALASRTRLR